MSNGRALDATIYLDGNNVHRSVKTGGNGIVGAFQIEVPPGEYEIYAVHDTGSNRLFSNRTMITAQASNSMFASAPITLIADQGPASPWSGIKAVPFAMAVILGVLLVIAGRALLNRK